MSGVKILQDPVSMEVVTFPFPSPTPGLSKGGKQHKSVRSARELAAIIVVPRAGRIYTFIQYCRLVTCKLFSSQCDLSAILRGLPFSIQAASFPKICDHSLSTSALEALLLGSVHEAPWRPSLTLNLRNTVRFLKDFLCQRFPIDIWNVARSWFFCCSKQARWPYLLSKGVAGNYTIEAVKK